MAEPVQDRYDRRKAEIVSIAASVFAAQGYHATTVDDLAKATNLQRGGLYHYIGSKLDLLADIHERFIAPLLEEALEIERRDQSAEEALREISLALMRVLVTYHDEAIVFVHEWRTIRTRPEWNAVRRRRVEFEEVIERILERGVQEGSLEVGDPRLSSFALLGMFNYSVQWRDPAGRFDADEIARYFADIFLRGHSVRPPVSATS